MAAEQSAMFFLFLRPLSDRFVPKTLEVVSFPAHRCSDDSLDSSETQSLTDALQKRKTHLHKTVISSNSCMCSVKVKGASVKCPSCLICVRQQKK